MGHVRLGPLSQTHKRQKIVISPVPVARNTPHYPPPLFLRTFVLRAQNNAPILFLFVCHNLVLQWAAHFNGKQRMFEMQIQGTLKLLPKGEVRELCCGHHYLCSSFSPALSLSLSLALSVRSEQRAAVPAMLQRHAYTYQ